jgi:hypothetical protein
MSRVIDLRPKLSSPPQQCSVTVDEMFMPYMLRSSRYRKDRALMSGKDPGCCTKTAKYIIDGRHYCAGHAGQKAIEILQGMIAVENEP